MNYIDCINHFWREDEQWAFSGNETRLYFFLLNLANRTYWKDWFEYGDERTTAYVGISVGVLRTAREKLKSASLIDYIAGGHGYRVKTRYQILAPKPNPKVSPNPEPIYNKTKTKNNFIQQKKNERFSKREYVASGSDFDE